MDKIANLQLDTDKPERNCEWFDWSHLAFINFYWGVVTYPKVTEASVM
jgi:hypothetical protein